MFANVKKYQSCLQDREGIHLFSLVFVINVCLASCFKVSRIAKHLIRVNTSNWPSSNSLQVKNSRAFTTR